jgi:hypothetical protein
MKKTAAVKESRTEYIRRIWAEAEAEVSVIHRGNCATCGGPGVVIPYMEVRDPDGNRHDVPLDKNSPLYRGAGMIRGHLICTCCSFAGCQHRTARQIQEQAEREAREITDWKEIADWAKAKRKQFGWS